MKQRVKLQDGVYLDIPHLMRTRLELAGGSGSGKSYRQRQIIELTYGILPHIILDLEGEYYTLREKYDYVLIGKKDCDINIEASGAKTLAKKIIELNTNVIIDLYEYKPYEKIRFVKEFIEGLMAIPQELYEFRLLFIDEADKFAPEKGKAESLGSIIDMASRGRKRGFAPVVSTQRPAKLDKDVAAECQNKIYGKFIQDIDVKRAGDEIGFERKDYQKFRKLKTGEFYAIGPAFCDASGKNIDHVIKLDPCTVKTSHPDLNKKSWRKKAKRITPTRKVKKILSKLIDLPHQAEKELHTIEEYKKEIRRLNRELRQKPKPKVETKNINASERQIKVAISNALKDVQAQHIRDVKNWSDSLKQAQARIHALESTLHKISSLLGKVGESKINIPRTDLKKIRELKPGKFFTSKPTPESKKPEPVHINNNNDLPVDEDFGKLPKAAFKMLQAAATYHPNPITRRQMGVLSGYPSSTGHFSNMMGELRKRNYVGETSGGIVITAEGLENAGDYESIPTSTEDLYEFWVKKLPTAAAKMLKALMDSYPEEITRAELGELAGYPHSTGHFSNMLGELRKRKLIEEGKGVLKASDILFNEDAT